MFFKKKSKESAILVNLEHIKALIKPDEVVLFETIDADHYYQSLFIFDLQERLHDPSSANLPFELKVFESILVSVGYGLRDQLQKLSPKVLSLLRKLETNRIDRDTLFSILDLSKKLTKYNFFLSLSLSFYLKNQFFFELIQFL